jgi:hypothetical protein
MVGSSASVSGAAKPSGPASQTNAIADYGAAPKPRQPKAGPRVECGGKQADQRRINSKRATRMDHRSQLVRRRLELLIFLASMLLIGAAAVGLTLMLHN